MTAKTWLGGDGNWSNPANWGAPGTSSPTAKKPTCAKCCLHDTGEVLTSDPAQYPQVCCHCGYRTTRRELPPDLTGHGPFYPR